MEKRLSEYISDCDLIIVGIGNEWNWIRSGINGDERYDDLVQYSRREGNEWLLPVLEFEYAYYNNNETIDKAYKALRKLIGEKRYFLISELFIQDALLNGFEEKLSVYPCGTYRFLQTMDATDPLMETPKVRDFMDLVDKVHKIIAEDNGRLEEGEKFNKPFFSGKELYLNQKRLEYSNIKYNESAYLPNWDMYMKYLTETVGSNLLLLELGVSLDYPTVIRWPFEKVAFINNKAHLVRVHEKLYQHTPEIKDKTDSIKMNSVDYTLQESEGL